MYKLFYITHVICVCLSVSSFIWRASLLLRNHPLLTHRWIKIAPHIIDTILLASAIGLTMQLGQYPFVHAWLSTKVIMLLFYIGFGIFTFRFAQSRQSQRIGTGLALLCIGYIILVALTKSPSAGFF